MSAGPCETLELRLGEARQLFLAIDAAPFRERDLDPRAEEFILGWAQELRRDAPLALEIHLERPSPAGDDAAVLGAAVAEYFRDRAQAARRRLRELLRTGRTSLLIGLAFNALMLVLADVFSERRYGIVHDSLVIGGWVAMWRPIEIFLYDWWPIRAEARLHDRLAAMPVRVVAAPPAP
ncbi:MAG: hypothetical protein OZ948_07805 [Deltaproteobacteria bacterium]|nr:hypothetical protein [Deltaproteobacteria bacterium]